jgi:hypothetical protein
MLTKLSIWLSKVPHYVLVIAMAVTVFGPDVARDMGLVPSLSPFAHYVMLAVAYASGILALAKQFSPGTAAAAASDKGIQNKQVSVPPTLPVLALFLFPLFIGATCSPAAVQNALSPAEQCIAGDALQIALSGGFADPAVAIAQILATCAGVTIDDFISLLNKLPIKGPDGGVVAETPQLVALRAYAVRYKAEHK